MTGNLVYVYVPLTLKYLNNRHSRISKIPAFDFDHQISFIIMSSTPTTQEEVKKELEDYLDAKVRT